jgi:hypothetical protein
MFLPAGGGREAPIHPRDIAAVAVKTLTPPRHEGKIYDLTGPEFLSHAEMAEKLSAVTGRRIRHVDETEGRSERPVAAGRFSAALGRKDSKPLRRGKGGAHAHHLRNGAPSPRCLYSDRKIQDRSHQREMEKREKEEAQIRRREVSRDVVEAGIENLKAPDQCESGWSRPKAESTASPRLANAKIKWAARTCILALSSVISVYWPPNLNARAEPSAGNIRSTSTNTTPPQSGQIQNIDDLPVFTLDAPPFRADTAKTVQSAPQEFKLNLLSARPNNITDEDNWFESNQLPRLPEVRPPAQPENAVHQDRPEAIPRSWRGKNLITVILQQDRALLIYGESYNNALLLASLNLSTKLFEYGLDFKNYGYSPENIPEDREFTQQYIHWASQVEDVLYVSHGHDTYAKSSKGRTGYVTAINIKDKHVLWSSSALISNAKNFEIIEDYLITGYGFTAEPDYLFVLRRKTGELMQTIKLKSGPDYIIRKDNDIYVRAYDTDYVFRMQRKN